MSGFNCSFRCYNEIITELLEQGDIFGQLNLEREDQDGEFAQVTKTDASICTFTVGDFEKILEKVLIWLLVLRSW
ncbi:MAG: hypothetical protein H7329_06270 [Opitutaceae bacterium]|nr:hypothetical protein [Cytophagales bacterium]